MAQRAAQQQQQQALKQNNNLRHRGSNCVCFRPQQEVYCMDCGHSFRGRQRMHCPVHPMTMFLLDVPCCPTCQSLHITERPKV